MALSRVEAERRREPGSMGWWASPELVKLANRPGFLSSLDGGQTMRDLYVAGELFREDRDVVQPMQGAHLEDSLNFLSQMKRDG